MLGDFVHTVAGIQGSLLVKSWWRRWVMEIEICRCHRLENSRVSTLTKPSLLVYFFTLQVVKTKKEKRHFCRLMANRKIRKAEVVVNRKIDEIDEKVGKTENNLKFNYKESNRLKQADSAKICKLCQAWMRFKYAGSEFFDVVELTVVKRAFREDIFKELVILVNIVYQILYFLYLSLSSRRLMWTDP